MQANTAYIATSQYEAKLAKKEPETVKQVLDRNIQESKQRTEAICINKAKLETLGLLDMPYTQLNNLLSTWPTLAE